MPAHTAVFCPAISGVIPIWVVHIQQVEFIPRQGRARCSRFRYQLLALRTAVGHLPGAMLRVSADDDL